jgi:hypothetical protein
MGPERCIVPDVATKRNPDQRPIRLVPPELPLADAANLIQITAERQSARIAAGLVAFTALIVLGSAGLVLVMATAVAVGVTWLTPRVAHARARTQRALAGARQRADAPGSPTPAPPDVLTPRRKPLAATSRSVRPTSSSGA